MFFLSSADVERIKGYVPQAILAVEHLVVAFENNTPIAFLGTNEGMLEMLFVDADVRRRDIGSALLEYGVSELGIRELTVNEQNPAAVAFYEAHGFRTVDRLNTVPLLRVPLPFRLRAQRGGKITPSDPARIFK